MVLAISMGIFGYFLRRADVPIAPIILGMLLGPIFDQNLRRALIASDGSLAPFVEDPFSLTLLALAAVLALFVMLAPAYRRMKSRRIKGAA
jgi:putative tricarboxylic transport membrane protein